MKEEQHFSMHYISEEKVNKLVFIEADIAPTKRALLQIFDREASSGSTVSLMFIRAPTPS